MTSRVEVPPLTGLIHFFLSSLRVKGDLGRKQVNSNKKVTVSPKTNPVSEGRYTQSVAWRWQFLCAYLYPTECNKKNSRTEQCSRHPITGAILRQMCRILKAGYISEYTDCLLQAVCAKLSLNF